MRAPRLLAGAASGGRTADQAEAADEPENDQGASEAGAFKQLVTELPGLLPAGGLVVRLVTARSSLAIRPPRQPIFCGVSERLATPFQLRKTPRGGDRPASQMRPAGDGERHNGDRRTCLTAGGKTTMRNQAMLYGVSPVFRTGRCWGGYW